MIGERIKQARTAAGYTTRDLGEKAGVSAMAISKYERGESTPSSRVLLEIAKALGVRVDYFFRQAQLNLERVSYRKHRDMPAKEERKILADVQDQIERWLELEAFLTTPWSVPFEAPKELAKQIADLDQIEDVAVKVRDAWDLGLNPILDLIDTLEERGITVIATPFDADQKFDGFSAKANGKPVIVINETAPGDRQRFTLAHELGHLILKDRLPRKVDEEGACNRFAGAFLVPEPSAKKALGNKRTWLEPQELALLKQEWGLSMGGWSYRARDLGVLPQIHMRSLWNLFREHGWDKKEPEPQYPREETRLFKQLVYRALAEEMVSESKAAELLGMTLMQLHACRKMECPDEVAHQ
jgi:Zn-dependent peptidase ImmA (M78 family)/DNA-binding XRE family transcriptional regulator